MSSRSAFRSVRGRGGRRTNARRIPDSRTLNGALTHSSSGSPLVDLYFQSVRGCEKMADLTSNSWSSDADAALISKVGSAVLGRPLSDQEKDVRTWTLRALFHLRNIRHKGKGERKAFLDACMWLSEHHTDSMVNLVLNGWIPHHGCWRDLFALAEQLNTVSSTTPAARAPGPHGPDCTCAWPDGTEPAVAAATHPEWASRVLAAICQVAVNQLKADVTAFWAFMADVASGKDSVNPPSVSLLAKWVPSEGAKFSFVYSRLASLFGQHKVAVSTAAAVHWCNKESKALKGVDAKAASFTITGSNESFRRWVLTPLRAHLDIVEHYLHADKAGDVEYGKVPSKAFQRYKALFEKWDEARFKSFVNRAKELVDKAEKGELTEEEQKEMKTVKVNVATLQPHEILRPYIARLNSSEMGLRPSNAEEFACTPCTHNAGKGSNAFSRSYYGYGRTVACEKCKAAALADAQAKWDKDFEARTTEDETVELQWATYRNQLREKFFGKDGAPPAGSLAIVSDFSGSMFSAHTNPSTLPAEVATAMTLLISEVVNTEKDEKTDSYTPNVWANRYLNFSTSPVWQHIPSEGSLIKKVMSLNTKDWAGSTNLQGAMDALIQHAQSSEEARRTMPKILLIVSDMQFDSACGHYTNFEVMRSKFTAAGLEMPRVAFWNVSASCGDSPVTVDDNGVGLISGFNPEALDVVLRADPDDWNPIRMVLKMLASEHLDDVVFPVPRAIKKQVKARPSTAPPAQQPVIVGMSGTPAVSAPAPSTATPQLAETTV